MTVYDVVKSLLAESPVSNPFDSLEQNDSEAWIRAKMYLMDKVEVNLRRPLTYYESQMFLFRKICSICDSRDLSVLKTCECGISYCKNHNDNLHYKICREFSLSFKLSTTENLRNLHHVYVKPKINTINGMLPLSMDGFVNSCLSLEKEISEAKKKLNTRDFEKLLISDRFSRPLTFLYSLQKLRFEVPKTMIIHVIGSVDSEYLDANFWGFALFWRSTLTALKIIFIGPEMSPLNKTFIKSKLHFPSVSNTHPVNLDVPKCVQERYEDYFHSASFEKPDIIMGYNLEIQESLYGIPRNNCTWKDAILALAEQKVPFVLTAETEEQALKDHIRICSFLGRSVDYAFCEENPFASLIRKKDIYTDGLRRSNGYIVIYPDLNQSLVQMPKLKDSGNQTEPALSTYLPTNKSEFKQIGVKNPESSAVKMKLTCANNAKVESKQTANLEPKLKAVMPKTNLNYPIKMLNFEKDRAGTKNIRCETKRTEELKSGLKAEKSEKSNIGIEWNLMVKKSNMNEKARENKLLDLIKAWQEQKKVDLSKFTYKSKPSQLKDLQHETKLIKMKNLEKNQDQLKLVKGKDQKEKNRSATNSIRVKNPAPKPRLLENAEYKPKPKTSKPDEPKPNNIMEWILDKKSDQKKTLQKNGLHNILKPGLENKRFVRKVKPKLEQVEIEILERQAEPANTKNAKINQIKAKRMGVKNPVTATRNETESTIVKIENENSKKKAIGKENVICGTKLAKNVESQLKEATLKKETNLDQETNKNKNKTEPSDIKKTDQEVEQAGVVRFGPKVSSPGVKNVELEMQPNAKKVEKNKVQTKLTDVKNSERDKAEQISSLVNESEKKLQNEMFPAITNVGYETKEYGVESFEYKPNSVLIGNYQSELKIIMKIMESWGETFEFQTKRTENLELKPYSEAESNLVNKTDEKRKLHKTVSPNIGKVGHEAKQRIVEKVLIETKPSIVENSKLDLKSEIKNIETKMSSLSTLTSTCRIEIPNSDLKPSEKESLESESKLGANETSNKGTNLDFITKESDNEQWLHKTELSKPSQSEIFCNETSTIQNFNTMNTGCETTITEIVQSLFLLFKLICIWILMHLKLKCENFVDSFMNQNKETTIENFLSEIEPDVCSVESKVNLLSAQNSSSGKFEMTPVNLQNRVLETKLGQSTKCKSKSRKTKNLNFKTKSTSLNRKLPKEKLLLKETQELLMEKILLQEEMVQLADEKLYLQQECQRVRQENLLINDIKRQIKEGIAAAFQDED